MIKRAALVGLAWLTVFGQAVGAPAMSIKDAALVGYFPPGELFRGYADKDPRTLRDVQLNTLEARANGGDPVAQFHMGLRKGNSYDPGAKEAALGWYRTSAKAGYAPSEYNLAILLLEAAPMGADPPEAVELLRAAAEQGFGPAEREYARRFLFAKPANPAEGLKWLERAAEHGDPRAMAAVAAIPKRKAFDAEMAANTIAKPEPRWRGNVVQQLVADHSDVTLMDAACPVATSPQWQSATMFVRPSGALNPFGMMWAACWRPDPTTPTRLDVCPFTQGGKLLSGPGACDYPFR